MKTSQRSLTLTVAVWYLNWIRATVMGRFASSTNMGNLVKIISKAWFYSMGVVFPELACQLPVNKKFSEMLSYLFFVPRLSPSDPLWTSPTKLISIFYLLVWVTLNSPWDTWEKLQERLILFIWFIFWMFDKHSGNVVPFLILLYVGQLRAIETWITRPQFPTLKTKRKQG